MKKYERNFKINAVKLSYEGEKRQIASLARELGIAPAYLYNWRQDFKKFGSGSFCGSGHPKLNTEQAVIFNLEKKIKDSEITLDILKKGTKYISQGKEKARQFIENNKSEFSIAKMLAVLELSESTYYKRKKQEITEKESQLILLKQEIIAVYYEFDRRYGFIKITKELQCRGFKVNKSSVKSYMRILGLRRKVKRKFKATTDSKHNYYTAPNILNQQFKTDAPSKVWVSDITYIQTKTGFLYLTIIMDLYDRKIIGWSLSSNLFTEATTLPALEMAVKNRNITDDLIFHSDRGVQYANKIFTNALDSHLCVTRSMSRRQNHTDNAVAESFFSSFKKESINGSKLLSKKEMSIEVYEYIENWYNIKRRHSFLEYKTIEEFGKLNCI